jgi:hypothetical protein
MKKLVLFSIYFALSIPFMAKDLKGKVIYQDGKEETVTIDVPTDGFRTSVQFFKMHKKVDTKNAAGEKIKITPEIAKEIQFEFNEENFRLVTKEIKEGKKLFLLALFKSEKISVYQKSEAQNNQYGLTITTYDYYQKGDSELFYFPKIGFKKNMSNYFNDCTKLVSKIDAGDYKQEDSKEIAKFYAEQCK